MTANLTPAWFDPAKCAEASRRYRLARSLMPLPVVNWFGLDLTKLSLARAEARRAEFEAAALARRAELEARRIADVPESR